MAFHQRIDLGPGGALRSNRIIGHRISDRHHPEWTVQLQPVQRGLNRNKHEQTPDLNTPTQTPLRRLPLAPPPVPTLRRLPASLRISRVVWLSTPLWICRGVRRLVVLPRIPLAVSVLVPVPPSSLALIPPGALLLLCRPNRPLKRHIIRPAPHFRELHLGGVIRHHAVPQKVMWEPELKRHRSLDAPYLLRT